MVKSFVVSVLALLVLAAPVAAAPQVFFAHLLGPSEDPPVASPGTGFTLVTIDSVAHTLRVDVDFADLLGTTTLSHIHVINGPGDADLLDTNGPVATTTPTFVGFPAGVTSGTYDMTFDTLDSGSYRAGFVTDSAALNPALTSLEAAELELFSAIQTGRAYLNIHTDLHPGGEIRGFLQLVPEPNGLLLAAVALGGVALRMRRRR